MILNKAISSEWKGREN